MFRVRALAVLSATVLGVAGALSGCSYSQPAKPVEEPVGLALDAPRVTLLEPGEGAGTVLAYKDLDASQELTYEVATGFDQQLRKDGSTAPSPATKDKVTLPLQASVEAATENVEGQLPASRNAFVTVGKPEADGTDVTSAEGFQFGWRGTDTGQMNSLRLAAPQAATDQARSTVERAITSLTSLPIVFPDEEIGPGATWVVESRVTGESTLLQTTTYTLDKLDGDIAELSVKIEQRPSLGALSFDGADAPEELRGKELKVTDHTSTSEGSVTVDLTKPLPTAGDVSVTTAISYGAEGSDLRVVQTSATEMEFTTE
ncbi:DUF6263 family protein [Corynebacterium sp. HMSC072A04]|uniref:DUF6263 family protein n=1 Tax=Corynebacterium sp. HMSC072A04 TaxID=1715045 RepID=UPI0008C696EC|nr:DUF6263 family protein [Corynebacterium sp. HMSC072A04]OFN38539.1 hypothetical protein HMPREF2565_02655 [Corynebacterium sp. HMSC072A04]